MTIKNWTHKNVNSKGIVKGSGSVNLKKGISTSVENGCTIPTCKCYKGSWLTISFGYDRKNKSISGTTLFFNNSAEFNNFISNCSIPFP